MVFSANMVQWPSAYTSVCDLRQLIPSVGINVIRCGIYDVDRDTRNYSMRNSSSILLYNGKLSQEKGFTKVSKLTQTEIFTFC